MSTYVAERLQKRIDLTMQGFKAHEIDQIMNDHSSQARQLVVDSIVELPFVKAIEHPDQCPQLNLKHDQMLVQFSDGSHHVPTILTVSHSWERIRELQRKHNEALDTYRQIFMRVLPDFSPRKVKRDFIAELRSLDGRAIKS